MFFGFPLLRLFPLFLLLPPSITMNPMVRIPASLERKLKELFPRALERDKFVKDTLENALEDKETILNSDMPEAIGGTLHLFTDGGSRGNPGQAAIGCILENPQTGEVLREHLERIGITTNNVAEYMALIGGLKLAKKYHPNRLVCHLDSELVVRQLSGEYKVKMHSLQPLVEEINNIKDDLSDVSFVYIPRSDNFRADTLVNRALDELPTPSYEKPE